MAQIDGTEMDYLLTLIRVKTMLAPETEETEEEPRTTTYYALPDDDEVI